MEPAPGPNPSPLPTPAGSRTPPVPRRPVSSGSSTRPPCRRTIPPGSCGTAPSTGARSCRPRQSPPAIRRALPPEPARCRRAPRCRSASRKAGGPPCPRGASPGGPWPGRSPCGTRPGRQTTCREAACRRRRCGCALRRRSALPPGCPGSLRRTRTVPGRPAHPGK